MYKADSYSSNDVTEKCSLGVEQQLLTVITSRHNRNTAKDSVKHQAINQSI